MSIGFRENFEMPVGSKKHSQEKKETTKSERIANSDYEKFWKKFKKNKPEAYENTWLPKYRKSYLEQGAEVVTDVHEKKPDTIVFLDKSARPLAGFFRAIWRRLYKDESSPEMRFMTGMEFYRHTENEKKRMVSTFKGSQDVFNNKKVLIIDEFSRTGAALVTASSMLKDAFPRISQIMFGSMFMNEDGQERIEKNIEKNFDIQPPRGSTYSQLKKESGNVSKIGLLVFASSGNEVKENNGDFVTHAAREVPASETMSYQLRQLGKHETLDVISIDGLQKRIEDEGEEKIARIRAAYENLQVKE